MKTKLFTVVLFLSQVALAQTSSTSTTTIRTNPSKATVKPWSLEFLVATEQIKTARFNKYDGTFTKMDASLLQGLTPNDEVRYFLSSRYVTSEIEDTKEFNWYFTEFMYRRKNILTENEHGINMKFEFKNLYYLDPEIRDQYDMNGSTIPQVIFKQKVGKYGSFELKLRKHFNHTNANSALAVDTEDRAYLNLSAMVSRRVLLFNQFKYQHKFRKDEGPNYKQALEVDMITETVPTGPGTTTTFTRPDFDSLQIAKKEQELVTWHPSVMYFLSRNSMVEFYYETKLSNTYDKRDLAKIMADESVFGTAFYITAF